MSKKLVIAVVIIVLLALGFYIYNSSAKAGVSGNAVSVEWCNSSDINKDGSVSIGDLTIVSDNYGRSDCSVANLWCNGADINKDGKVTIGDMSLVSENYGKTGCVNSGGFPPAVVSCKAGSDCFSLAKLSLTANKSDTGGTENDRAEFVDLVIPRSVYLTGWIVDGQGGVGMGDMVGGRLSMFGSSSYASEQRLVAYYPDASFNTNNIANNISNQNVSVGGIVLSRSKELSVTYCPVYTAKCINGLRLTKVVPNTGRPEFSANLTFVDIVDGRSYLLQVPAKLNYTYLSYKGVNYPVRYYGKLPNSNITAPLGGRVEFNAGAIGTTKIKVVPEQQIYVGGVAVIG